jgi:hypothetical protein
MVITQFAIMMTFGAIVAITGMALLYFRKEYGENKFKIWGQEFQFSTPALAVFLVGCGIFILPSVISIQNQTVLIIPLPWRTSGKDLPGPGPLLTSGEEHEPNDQITTPNLIAVGSTTKGRISTDQDRDFFKFKTGQGLKTRVILRKTSPGGFYAQVVVYDSTEGKVKADNSPGEDAVSFAFESIPGTYYYVMVEGIVGGRGPYELLIREE